MTRLIDADALLNRFNTEIPIRPVSLTYDMGTVLKAIMDSPTVDAEPVRHGRWMTCEDGWGDEHYQCSECGEEWVLNDGTPKENNMNYCPNCGALMQEARVEPVDGAARVVPLEELFNGAGVGYEENWLKGEDGEEDAFEVNRCAWCNGGVVLNDAEYVSRAALERLYNKPYGLRVWSREPSAEQRERTPWDG